MAMKLCARSTLLQDGCRRDRLVAVKLSRRSDNNDRCCMEAGVGWRAASRADAAVTGAFCSGATAHPGQGGPSLERAALEDC